MQCNQTIDRLVSLYELLIFHIVSWVCFKCMHGNDRPHILPVKSHIVHACIPNTKTSASTYATPKLLILFQKPYYHLPKVMLMLVHRPTSLFQERSLFQEHN